MGVVLVNIDVISFHRGSVNLIEAGAHVTGALWLRHVLSLNSTIVVFKLLLADKITIIGNEMCV